MMNWLKLYWKNRNQPENIFTLLVSRETRRRRRDERQLAEQCIIKHQVWARSSCVADARNYRVARCFPTSELDWGN
jgi:hypothetical protein